MRKKANFIDFTDNTKCAEYWSSLHSGSRPGIQLLLCREIGEESVLNRQVPSVNTSTLTSPPLEHFFFTASLSDEEGGGERLDKGGVGTSGKVLRRGLIVEAKDAASRLIQQLN